MQRCDGYEGGVKRCGKVRQLSGSVKGIKHECQLMVRCDGYEGGARRCGKVLQLSGSVTGGLSVVIGRSKRA